MSEPKPKRQRNPRPVPRPLTDDDGEVRELTLADFRRMKPVREAMPELIEAMADVRKKAGRPKAEAPKVHIGFRLSADLVERIRATGPGYNARVEEALRDGLMGRSASGNISAGTKVIGPAGSRSPSAKGAPTGKRRA